MPSTTIRTTGVLKEFDGIQIGQYAQATTDHGIVQVPPGLNNAIAQVEKCQWGTYKEKEGSKVSGKKYWFVSAVICEPTTFATPSGVLTVRGLHIRKQVGLFESTFNGVTTTLQDRFAEIMNELRCLMGDKFTHGIKSMQDLERKVAECEAKRPYIHFSSWMPPAQEGRTPQVTFILHRPADYKGPQQTGVKGVTDRTSTTNGSPTTQTSTSPSKGRKANPPPKHETQQEETNQQQTFDEFGDLSSLGDRAASGDVEAQRQLLEYADKLNVADEFNKIDGWQEGAEFLATTMATPAGEKTDTDDEEPGGEEEPVDVEDRLPIKNLIYKWWFKTKEGKRASKPIKLRVDSVNLHDNVVSGTNMDNKKTYKTVRFDELEPWG